MLEVIRKSFIAVKLTVVLLVSSVFHEPLVPLRVWAKPMVVDDGKRHRRASFAHSASVLVSCVGSEENECQ